MPGFGGWQYAERVWDITTGDEPQRIDLAVEKTRAVFESLGVKTRLAEHDVAKEDINKVVQALEVHGMTAPSETGDLELSVSRQILEVTTHNPE